MQLCYNILIERGGYMGKWDTKRKTNIGGQALIEGVMMRGPRSMAIAVRKPDSTIEVDKKQVESYTKKNKILGLPLIRGSVSLIESLVIGVNALTYSAKFYETEEEEPGKFEKFLARIFGEKMESVVMGFSVFLSLVLAVGIFFVLPSIATNWIPGSHVLKNLTEGIIRVILFIIYIYLISRMEDIKRVFQYHGAEHKSIYCYENQEELTVENARKYITLHPRCGTNFLFIVMIVSILVYSFLGWPNFIVRILSRVIMLPIIAGISYEILRILGRSDSKFLYALFYPGLLLQKLTTAEPDDSQLEVALAALKEVLADSKGDDLW
jgi:Predicted metal-dependent enzyme